MSLAQNFRPERGLFATGFALWPYLWPTDRPDLQRRVMLCFVLIVIAKVVTIGVPFTFKWATDALVAATGGRAETPTLLPWIIGAPVAAVVLYGLARILMALVQQLRDGLFAKVALNAVRKLGLETFEHMHRLSLRFHLEKKTGGLTRVLERGREGIEELSRMFLMVLIPTILEFVLVCAVLWTQFDWRYVAVVTVMIALYMWFTLKTTEWRIGIRREMNESDTDSNAKAVDSLLNFETVKYFGAEKRELNRYDRALDGFVRGSVKTYTSLAVLNAGQAVIFTVGLTIVMVMSVLDVLAGRVSIGGFIMVNALMMQLYMPLNFMGMVYREIKQALTDIERMFDILGQSPEIADKPGATPLAVDGGTIRFEDVHFHYDPSRQILKGVTFEVPAGHTIAIVGPSGAGKSTISRILYRFYDIERGRVTIDGQDIREVTQDSLRTAIGMVPQDTVLFNDTIRYNIRYGRAGASDAEVEEAAGLAQIDRFVRALPEGYDTQVGERGLKLSGGEKQRVAIARTILKGPPILILDEATSALDTHTEREIQEALDRVVENRTSIVIAHRLSTVVNADQILVLDAGRIVERGTHTALLTKGGVYASMWNRQRELAEAEEHLREVRGEAGEPNAIRAAAE